MAASDQKTTDIARLAHEQAQTIRPRVPRLVIVRPSAPPPDLVVTLDGERVQDATLDVPLPVDPGSHHLEARGREVAPFARTIDLREGQSTRIELAFTASSTPAAAPPEQAEVAQGSSGPDRRTWGFVALGAGAVLTGASIAFLVAHNGSADDLREREVQDGCHADACPSTLAAPEQAQLENLHTAAQRNQALSIIFAGTAAAAVGVGVYLLVTGSHKTETPAAWVSPTPAGVALGGSF
jgi:hypothetical protein